MSKILGTASAVIDAPPAAIYAVLSNYVEEHPRILPRPYFTGLQVESGGKGAGTVFHADMEIMGRRFHYHMDVTEPEPGRRLVESDRITDTVTEFLLEPLDNGNRTHLTIRTEVSASPGFAGVMERLFTPMLMRSIYKKELVQIAEYVRESKTSKR